MKGIRRKLDDLGRIVLPIELRREYGLGKGDEIEIITRDDGLLIRTTNVCEICYRATSEAQRITLCEACLQTIKLKRREIADGSSEN